MGGDDQPKKMKTRQWGHGGRAAKAGSGGGSKNQVGRAGRLETPAGRLPTRGMADSTCVGWPLWRGGRTRRWDSANVRKGMCLAIVKSDFVENDIEEIVSDLARSIDLFAGRG